MKTFASLFISLSAAMAIAAPNVESVKIRQLWPWSSDVRVEYTLSGNENGVNLSFEAFDGQDKIAGFDKLQKAVKGKFRAINAESGFFDVDIKALGLSVKAVSNFNIKLEAVEDDELYRIYDLTTGEYDKVTRGELLNGDYGTVETDFAKVGRAFGVDGFNTSLDDVVIWTGVTNDVAYKTTKLAMRKILAKNKSFMMGVNPGDYYENNSNFANAPCHEVTFTNDYFIGVFELTDGQQKTIKANVSGSTMSDPKMRFPLEPYRAMRPVNISDVAARANAARWPGSFAKGSFSDNKTSLIGNLRELTGEIGFDLPTESFWEYACRAGTKTTFNNGLNDVSAKCQNSISRHTGNSHMDYTNYNKDEYILNCSPDEGGTAIVGTYAPNAWGLYDMHGNILEWCLDHYSADPTGYDGYTSVDPWGIGYTSTGVLYEDLSTNDTTKDPGNTRLYHVGRGGDYHFNQIYNTSASRLNVSANSSSDPRLGIRICITVFD